VQELDEPSARYTRCNGLSAGALIRRAGTMRDEQADDLRLLFARFGTSTAASTRRLNGEV